ncbi:MAG: M28 family peptidase [Bacteroidales bacterium]|nr:M28 family peptidase [Bacteroidales bacterium]
MGVSDSYVFAQNSIPTFYINTGPSNTLHTPRDVEENINYEGMEKIFSFLLDLIKFIDENDLK